MSILVLLIRRELWEHRAFLPPVAVDGGWLPDPLILLLMGIVLAEVGFGDLMDVRDGLLRLLVPIDEPTPTPASGTLLLGLLAPLHVLVLIGYAVLALSYALGALDEERRNVATAACCSGNRCRFPMARPSSPRSSPRASPRPCWRWPRSAPAVSPRR